MKYQIRQGVFETNSSSTHSMQIVDASINDPKKIVKEIIEEAYGEKFNRNSFDECDYIENGVLTLQVLNMEDSDEDKVVIHVIKNIVAKIEYLFMDLLNFTYYFDTLKSVNKYSYDVTRSQVKNLIKESSEYQWFKKAVMDYLTYHYPDMKIKDIVIGYCEDFYGTYSEETIFNEEIIKSEEKIRDKVFEILDEDSVILDKDVAYSPYQSPVIINF